MLRVRTEDLKEGYICAALVYDGSGRHLVKAGTVINSGIREKLLQAEIPYIYIKHDFISASSPFDSDTCSQVLKAAGSFIESDGSNRELLKRYAPGEIKIFAEYSGETASKIGYAHLFLYYSSLLAAQALKNPEKPYDIRDFRNKHNYYDFHPLGAACLSILIGREAGLNQKELTELAAGAMLYDCKMKLYPFASENRKLTGQEAGEVASHAAAGYDFLKSIYGLPAKTALIAWQHHERYDGSGYPKGIKNDSINLLSRIAAVADVYDALISERPFRPAYTAEESRNYILENSGVLFDPEVCAAFAKCAVKYLPGASVVLEDGSEAVVTKNHAADPEHPVIKLIEKKEGSAIIFGTEIDTAAGEGRKIIQTTERGI